MADEKKAYFAGGCFWCVEGAYKDMKGIKSALPGYAGGHDPNPNYNSVCGGGTGHAEVVEVIFDESVISYQTILEVFFTVHDPTQLNRQGNDIGTQYRSAIFYVGENDERSKLLRSTIICVNRGSSAPKSLKIPAKVGIRKMVIPRNTRMAITSTATG